MTVVEIPEALCVDQMVKVVNLLKVCGKSITSWVWKCRKYYINKGYIMITVNLDNYRYIVPQLDRFVKGCDPDYPIILTRKLNEFACLTFVPCIYIYCYAIEKYGKMDVLLRGVKSVSDLYGYTNIKNFKDGIVLEGYYD